MGVPENEGSQATYDDGPGDIHLSEAGGDNDSNTAAGPDGESFADCGRDGLTRAVSESGSDTLSPPDDGRTDTLTDTTCGPGFLAGNGQDNGGAADSDGGVSGSTDVWDFLGLDDPDRMGENWEDELGDLSREDGAS